MHVLTKRYYEALDGKIFDTKEECFMHELKINNVDMDKDIALFDINDNKINFSINDESEICNIDMVIVKSKGALYIINEIFKYYGYYTINCNYNDNKKVCAYRYDYNCSDWIEYDLEERIESLSRELKKLEELNESICD